MTSHGTPIPISNTLARRIFMERQGLLAQPTPKQSKADLLALIEKLGFVQVDSIATVERAHHMILFARNQTYRREQLTELIESDRALFENWTHDASIIPTAFYPQWQRRFERDGESLRARWQKWRREGFEDILDEVVSHIGREGPVLSRSFGSDEKKSNGGWWDWHPSKTALEYLWRIGRLAVTRREAFQKVYDLSEHVIPPEYLDNIVSDEELIDWKCRNALKRLGFATPGELAAFWGGMPAAEAQAWSNSPAARDLPRVIVEGADGSISREALACPSILSHNEKTLKPPPRLRVISPFDPVIRDRKRLKRLFDYRYRIEVFVPEAKREYGYYVFPLLEGDRFVGRIDMKRDLKTMTLNVTGLWWEPGIRQSQQRQAKLEAELNRIARFAGCEQVHYAI